MCLYKISSRLTQCHNILSFVSQLLTSKYNTGIKTNTMKCQCWKFLCHHRQFEYPSWEIGPLIDPTRDWSPSRGLLSHASLITKKFPCTQLLLGRK